MSLIEPHFCICLLLVFRLLPPPPLSQAFVQFFFFFLFLYRPFAAQLDWTTSERFSFIQQSLPFLMIIPNLSLLALRNHTHRHRQHISTHTQHHIYTENLMD